MVFSRPPVSGRGMAGMMPKVPQFPPLSIMGTQAHATPRPSHSGQSMPIPMMPSQATTGDTCPITPYRGGKTILGRTPNIKLSPHWKADEEYCDSQKIHGFPLPRVIRNSTWSQYKDIEGCDPLTLPLCKLFYQGCENFWLRKLAAGKEVYVATMG